MLNVRPKDKVVDADFKKNKRKTICILARNILENVICTYVSRTLAR